MGIKLSFMNFMRKYAVVIGVVPWVIVYALASMMVSTQPNRGVVIALLWFQSIGMFFQVAFVIESWRKLFKARKQMKSKGL
jgi:hypothetical protein